MTPWELLRDVKIYGSNARPSPTEEQWQSNLRAMVYQYGHALLSLKSANLLKEK